MSLCILIILQVYVSFHYCEGCGDFSFGSSHYEANFVEVMTDYRDFKKWDDIKDMCQQDYQLVSITTSDENEAILDFLLENCTNGDYAIGLSRQEDMPRAIDSNWNWESGETAMTLEPFWSSGGEPNIEDTMCAVIYMTTLMGIYETGKWYDTSCTGSIGLVTGAGGYGYICERAMITTTQLPTTAGETTIQSSTSGTQSSSTNHMTSLSTTVGLIGETTEVQYGISDAAITNASSGEEHNDELDLLMIVLASTSPVLVIVILLLLYKFRERLGLCCKSKSKTNPELMMMDVVKNNPMPCDTLINSTENECYDIDSANKGDNSIVLDNGRPSISTANTKGQGKHSVNNNIQVQSMNTSSDNSRDSDTYHVIQSTSTYDRHPHDYKSEENSNYERYQEEEMGLIYAEITNESEGEVENPAYDALPFESESLYASPDKTPNVAGSGDVDLLEETGANVVPVDANDMVVNSNIDALYAKPDMNKTHKYQVQSPGNSTLPSETESNYASPDKTTDVVSGDVLKGTGVIVAPVDDNDKISDSNIDELYAKPDMNKKRRYQVQSPGNSTLPFETESNYASTDKTTDVVVSGDVLKGIGVIVAPVDDNDTISDSNIDDLYAKPDKTKIRKYQVQSPDSNTLPSETESNYVSLDKRTDVLVSGDVLKETGVIVAPVDNNDIALVDDSNIDALYAKPDMNKKRRHEVEGPDNNTLSSETESNYASSQTTDVVVSGDV